MSKKINQDFRNREKRDELQDALKGEPRFEITKETRDCFLLKFTGRQQVFPIIIVVNKLGYNAQVGKPKCTWASKHATHLLRNIESDLLRAAV